VYGVSCRGWRTQARVRRAAIVSGTHTRHPAGADLCPGELRWDGMVRTTGDRGPTHVSQEAVREWERIRRKGAGVGWKRYTAEQITNHPRQAESMVSKPARCPGIGRGDVAWLTYSGEIYSSRCTSIGRWMASRGVRAKLSFMCSEAGTSRICDT